MWYTWSGKNTDSARNEVPPVVWEAILTYLEATGREGSMRADDYVFTPLIDNAINLPNVDAAAWRRNRPLSPEAVNRLLRKYARQAGLDPRRVHVHLLRHSAAMLEAEAGAGLAEISRFLGHADPKTTMRYLNHLRGLGDNTCQRKVAILGLRVPDTGSPTTQEVVESANRGRA